MQPAPEIAFEDRRGIGALIVKARIVAGIIRDHRLHFAVEQAADRAVGDGRRRVSAFITSGEEEAYPILNGTHHFDLPRGARFSVVPFTDLAGLDLEGVKWPLTNRSVPLGSSLTVSNVATGPVTVQSIQPPIPNSDDYQATVAQLDRNNDGVVVRSEVPADHALASEFRLVDTDRNGRITEAELSNWK